jgi:hypothetical protein
MRGEIQAPTPMTHARGVRRQASHPRI